MLDNVAWQCLVSAWEWIGNNAATIIATVIAIAAAGFTWWQGWIARQHSCLSVRPRMQCFLAEDGGALEVVLQNAGLGPETSRAIASGSTVSN